MRPSPPPGPVTVLRGHEDSVNSLAFLSNSLLCSGGVDGVLKLWNLQTRRSILSFNGHGDSSILSLSPQYQTGSLVSCGRDGFVKTWKFDNEGVSRGSSDAVSSICTGSRHFCNASCDRLATSTHPHLVATPTSEETEIALWDLRDVRARVATIINTKNGQSRGNEYGMVCSLLLQSRCVAPVKRKPHDDNSPIVAGEGENSSPVAAAATDQDGDDNSAVSCTPQLYAGYEDGSVCCFDIRTFRCLHRVKLHDEPAMALDMSPDGCHLATAGAGNKIVRCSVTATPTNITRDVSCAPTAFREPSDNASPGVVDPLQGIGKDKGESDSSLSWGARAAAAAAEEAKSRQQSATTNTTTSDPSNPVVTMAPYDSFVLPAPGVSGIRYRSDGRILVSGHWDHSLRVFDSKRLKPIAVLRYHKDSVYCVDFAPPAGAGSGVGADFGLNGGIDGDSSVFRCDWCTPALFAAGSKDGSISLWNVFADTMRK